MAIMKIYAGSSASGMTQLPSPVELKTTREQIWSENTGRAQSGTNKAKMIGDVVATKRTYAIKWGILTNSELTIITSNLTKGFFYFAAATSAASAEDTASKYYRSEISYDYLQSATQILYKDVTVNVIEQ